MNLQHQEELSTLAWRMTEAGREVRALQMANVADNHIVRVSDNPIIKNVRETGGNTHDYSNGLFVLAANCSAPKPSIPSAPTKPAPATTSAWDTTPQSANTMPTRRPPTALPSPATPSGCTRLCQTANSSFNVWPISSVNAIKRGKFSI